MANKNEKAKIAINKNYDKQKPCYQLHQTTQTFCSVNVPFIKEMYPGQKLDIKTEEYTLLDPITAPTMGLLKNNTRFFFVPFHSVWKPFNSFIAGTEYYDNSGFNSLPNVNPKITNESLMNILIAEIDSFVNIGDSHDIAYYDANNTIKVARLNTYGKYYIKLLNQLGYYPIMNVNKGIKDFNALPLMCAGKIAYDFYYNKAYRAGSATLDVIKNLFNVPRNSLNLSQTQVKALLDLIRIPFYDFDYFTGAFDSPTGSNDNANDIEININSYSKSKVYPLANLNVISNNALEDAYTLIDNKEPAIITKSTSEQVGNALTYINHLSLQWLEAATKLAKKNQYVGEDDLERLFAMYGVKPRFGEDNRSIYIKSFESQIKLSPIYTTADTANGLTGGVTGDRAGKGDAYNDYKLSFKTSDFGMLIAFNTVIPETSIPEANNRTNLKETRLDYYTEEFDGAGVQDIKQCEVLSTEEAGIANAGAATFRTDLFGFTDRYADYCVFNDKLTGSYRGEFKDLYENYHMFRILKQSDYFTDVTGVDTDIVHNLSFTMMEDYQQFNRIFYSREANDNMQQMFGFYIENEGSKRKRYQDSLFDDEANGKHIDIQVNGDKVN